MAAIKCFGATSLVGGGTGALDALQISDLADTYRAVVIDEANGVLFFHFDAAATDAEDVATHPFKVRPDDYATAGVWIEIEPSKGHDRSHAVTSTDDHTSTSTENVIQKADANGLPVDSAITEDASSNVLIAGAAAAGTSAAKVTVLATGTAPTTCPADVGQIWVADRVGTAGQAGWHVKAGEEYNANLALGANLVHFAKEQMIAAVRQIVTSGIELFLVFDEYGATDTIADRSGNARNATLRNGSLAAINASTCSPALYGLAPHLQMDATHVWDVADVDGLSFGDGAGNDEAFSLLWFGYFNNAASHFFIGKRDDTTGSENSEYNLLYIQPDAAISFAARHLDKSAFIGRTAPSVSSGIRSFISTYDGSKAASGISVYIDGSQADTADSISGTYTGMSNGTAKLSSYRTNSGIDYICTSKSSVAMVIRSELTATQVSQLDAILRSWAGVMI